MHTLLDLQISRDLGHDSALSDADYDVLSTLSEAPHGSWRATALAARLLWSTSRLAHHVARMERRGLVQRRACDDDARGASIALTDGGRKVLDMAAPFHVRSVRHNLIDRLTPAELRTLTSITRKVIAHLDGGNSSD